MDGRCDHDEQATQLRDGRNQLVDLSSVDRRRVDRPRGSRMVPRVQTSSAAATTKVCISVLSVCR